MRLDRNSYQNISNLILKINTTAAREKGKADALPAPSTICFAATIQAYTNNLMQWFSIRGDSAPRRYLVVSEDIQIVRTEGRIPLAPSG